MGVLLALRAIYSQGWYELNTGEWFPKRGLGPSKVHQKIVQVFGWNYNWVPRWGLCFVFIQHPCPAHVWTVFYSLKICQQSLCVWTYMLLSKRHKNHYASPHFVFRVYSHCESRLVSLLLPPECTIMPGFQSVQGFKNSLELRSVWEFKDSMGACTYHCLEKTYLFLQALGAVPLDTLTDSPAYLLE